MDVTSGKNPLLGSPNDNAAYGDFAECEAHAVARLRREFVDSTVVCILGSTTFSDPAHETMVRQLAESLASLPLTFVTGGMPGVQSTFANNFGHEHKLWHVRPFGHPSGFERGRDIFAGSNEAEKKAIIGAVGDIYITIEGGPGVAFEANTADRRGALVLPLIRTGGASSGLYNFPEKALECPEFVRDESQWDLIKSHDVPIDDTVKSVHFLLKEYAKKAVMLDPYLWLPRWAVHSKVRQFAEDWGNKHTKQTPLPLGIVCGYGIFWAWAANVVTWPLHVTFVLLAYKTCTCNPRGGLANYDTRLWYFFCIFWMIQFYFEIKAMSYSIYCQVQATGAFRIFGVPLRFRQWFGMIVGMSIVSHMDIATNSFFTASAVYSQSCRTASMDKIWGTVIDQSLLKYFSEAFGLDFSIPNISLAVWLCTFIQPLYAIGLGVPLCEPTKWWPPTFCCKIDYEPRAKVNDQPGPNNQYTTCLSMKQNHGNALMATADVARMTAVTYQDESFAMSRFQCALDKLDKTMSHVGEVPIDQAIQCLEHANGLLQRSNFKFFIQGILEMSFMLNLQISLLGIQRCSTTIRMRSPDNTGFLKTLSYLNWQIMLSVFLGLFLAVRRFAHIYDRFSKAWHIIAHLRYRRSEEASKNAQLRCQFRIVMLWVMINVMVAFAYVSSVLYALIKFWAVFYCPSSLWNLALYPPDGCVKL